MGTVIILDEIQKIAATISFAEAVELIIARCDGDLDEAAIVLAYVLKDWPEPGVLFLQIAKYLIATRPS